jgi:hypothetical protein
LSDANPNRQDSCQESSAFEKVTVGDSPKLTEMGFFHIIPFSCIQFPPENTSTGMGAPFICWFLTPVRSGTSVTVRLDLEVSDRALTEAAQFLPLCCSSENAGNSRRRGLARGEIDLTDLLIKRENRISGRNSNPKLIHC